MKREKIIISLIFLILTIGTIFLWMYGDNFKTPKTVHEELIDLKNDLIAITHTDSFYNSEEQVNKILAKSQNYLTTDLDLFFSDINNFDGFILPQKNIYCIDAGGSEQTGKNFQTYRVYMSGKLTEEIMNMYGRHSQTAYDYIHGNEYDSSTTLGKMVYLMDENEKELLLYYNANDPIKFKKKIYEINGGENNADILTIVFFEKNKLDKNKAIDFLNRCFNYNNNGLINIEYLKENFYEYLVKQ